MIKSLSNTLFLALTACIGCRDHEVSGNAHVKHQTIAIELSHVNFEAFGKTVSSTDNGILMIATLKDDI